MNRSTPALLVGFDTETTGLDINHDEAISYGFAVFRDGNFSRGESHQFFVIPEAPLHPKAAEIHGISLHALEDGHVPGDVHSRDAGTERAVRTILEFAQSGAVFVGANPKYDLGMLISTMKRHPERSVRRYLSTIPKLHFHDVIDTHAQQNQTRRRSLATLCEIHGVQPGNHDALADARASVEVFLKQRVVSTTLPRVDLHTLGASHFLRRAKAVSASSN
jgi:DNA polymerase-3 subunit epsilon